MSTENYHAIVEHAAIYVFQHESSSLIKSLQTILFAIDCGFITSQHQPLVAGFVSV